MMKIISSTTTQDEATLTPDELRLIRIYRILTERKKSYMLAFAEKYAGNQPTQKKPGSFLRVIAGGAA
jgi:hypothetical protein